MKIARTFGLAGSFVLVATAAHAQPPKAPPPASSPAATPAAPKPAAAAPKYRSELPLLTLLSDDVENQAEALSGAIRSRLRERRGVIVDETTMNLTTLLAALNCGERPDPLCLLKIGDHLKVERFLWGTLKRGPEKGHVTAELHVWRRGKPDQVATDSFSDNLHDQNDDVLRRIAGRIVDKLMGSPLAAAVTVRAGDASGQIFVDGKEEMALERGEATIELRPGHHVIELRSPGFRTAVNQVDVVASTDQVLNVRLVPEEAERPSAPSKPISARTVASLGLIGAGAVFGVLGTVKAAQFLSLRDQNKVDHENLDATSFCDPNQPHKADLASMQDACGRITRAEDARKFELIFYGAAAVLAGAGLVLLITDTPDSDKDKVGQLRVLPNVSQRGGGLDLSLKF